MKAKGTRGRPQDRLAPELTSFTQSEPSSTPTPIYNNMENHAKRPEQVPTIVIHAEPEPPTLSAGTSHSQREHDTVAKPTSSSLAPPKTHQLTTADDNPSTTHLAVPAQNPATKRRNRRRRARDKRRSLEGIEHPGRDDHRNIATRSKAEVAERPAQNQRRTGNDSTSRQEEINLEITKVEEAMERQVVVPSARNDVDTEMIEIGRGIDKVMIGLQRVDDRLRETRDTLQRIRNGEWESEGGGDEVDGEPWKNMRHELYDGSSGFRCSYPLPLD
jgi:hypothetical protein